MSAAAAAPAGGSPPKGKKKLIIIVVVALLVLAIGGAAAMLMLKKKAAAEDEEGGETTTHAPAPAHSGVPPTFVPLDPFTVNLSDKESERYAQVALTLEIDDAKFADQVKLYMPAIRNNILMVLSHKTSAELLDREGKIKLAAEIARESVKPMGIEIEDEDADEAADEVPAKKKKKKKKTVHNPVTAVLFSNFIIQ